METWKPVYEGTYEVSDLGNVRRAKPGISTFVGRPVAPIFSGSGYAQVALRENGVTRRCYIHQLVALAFIGERPKGLVINHKDLNKLNNVASNLEYTTHRENHAHAFSAQGRKKGPTKPKQPLKGKQIGESHWMRRNPENIRHGEQLNSKLTASQVLDIRKRREEGASCRELTELFGLSMAQVSRICNRTRWSHL